MEIDIRRASGYLEMIVAHDETALHCGLLNESESIEMAGKLILAAEELLPAGYGKAELELSEIRLSLNKKHNS